MSVLTLSQNYWSWILQGESKTEGQGSGNIAGYANKLGVIRSCYRFSLADLPSGSTVSQVRFRLNIASAGGAAGVWDIRGYNSNGQTDPSPDSAATQYTRAVSGNLYKSDTTWRSSGETYIILGGNINTDVQNAKSAVNLFSIGIYEEGDNDTTPVGNFIGYTQLEITYTVAGGPTGVKTINDTAIASVKTMKDTAIASVKTLNG